MRRVLGLVAVLAALPAAAETPMTVEEFEAWSTGRTLDYTVDGTFWGSEQHLPGRLTRDSDVDGTCLEGQWFPQDGAICFAYDGNPGPHCWRFFRDGTTVRAEIDGDDSGALIEVVPTDRPLACQGPDVGV